MRPRLFNNVTQRVAYSDLHDPDTGTSSNIAATPMYSVAAHLSAIKILDPSFFIGGNPIISPVTSTIRAIFPETGLKNRFQGVYVHPSVHFHRTEYPDNHMVTHKYHMDLRVCRPNNRIACLRTHQNTSQPSHANTLGR